MKVPSRTPNKHWYPLENWFDPTTGLLAREIESSDGRTTIANFSDYQSVDGLMMAHEVQAIQDPGIAEDVKLTQSRGNVRTWRNIFAVPLRQ